MFDQFHADVRDGIIRLVPTTNSIVQRVEDVFRSAPTGVNLRAAEAIHLATAADSGFEDVYSNDRHFLAAAPFFELPVVNLIP